MTIFQLMVHFCIFQTMPDSTINTCKWQSHLGLFAEEQMCKDAGDAMLGRPIHQFTYVVDPPKVDQTRCDPISVYVKRKGEN
jgi:hypothetical protein